MELFRDGFLDDPLLGVELPPSRGVITSEEGIMEVRRKRPSVDWRLCGVGWGGGREEVSRSGYLLEDGRWRPERSDFWPVAYRSEGIIVWSVQQLPEGSSR